MNNVCDSMMVRYRPGICSVQIPVQYSNFPVPHRTGNRDYNNMMTNATKNKSCRIIIEGIKISTYVLTYVDTTLVRPSVLITALKIYVLTVRTGT